MANTARLRMPLRHKIAAAYGRLLDLAMSPVTSRLTDEQYFRCQTRGDCFRAYFGANFNRAA